MDNQRFIGWHPRFVAGYREKFFFKDLNFASLENWLCICHQDRCQCYVSLWQKSIFWLKWLWSFIGRSHVVLHQIILVFGHCSFIYSSGCGSSMLWIVRLPISLQSQTTEEDARTKIVRWDIFCFVNKKMLLLNKAHFPFSELLL